MTAAADSPVNAATDLAEHLVEQGTPFREAHTIVGALVRQSVERGVPLDELVSNDPRLGPDCLPLLEPGSAVRRRTTPGGGGPEPVARAARSRRATGSERQQAWLAHAERLDARVLRPRRARGRARAAEQGARRQRRRGAPRRGRGVPRRRRSRQPRVPAARRRATRRCSAARARCTCTSRYGNPLVHERGVRPGRAAARGAAARRRAARRARRRCASGASKAQRDRDLARGPGPARPGVRRRPVARRRRPRCAARCRIVDDGTPPPAAPGVSTRIGLGAGKGEDAAATASSCPATRT